jgi:hypothetical protein
MFGYASDRQVDHLVARLREVKFLEQRRAPGDGRVRLLASTHKLRTHHTEWLATHYIPLAALSPIMITARCCRAIAHFTLCTAAPVSHSIPCLLA